MSTTAGVDKQLVSGDVEKEAHGQRAFMETVDSTQRALTFMGASARVVMHAADRQQAVATDIGRRVRETLAGISGLRESTRRA